LEAVQRAAGRESCITPVATPTHAVNELSVVASDTTTRGQRTPHFPRPITPIAMNGRTSTRIGERIPPRARTPHKPTIGVISRRIRRQFQTPKAAMTAWTTCLMFRPT
jgi:hypothetical protein